MVGGHFDRNCDQTPYSHCSRKAAFTTLPQSSLSRNSPFRKAANFTNIAKFGGNHFPSDTMGAYFRNEYV